MTILLNIKKKYLSLLFIIFISGCDVIGDLATDCIDNDGPEFSLKTMPAAYLDQYYLTTIKASIKREPNDSSYNYYFAFDGDLPEGIYFAKNKLNRSVLFSGTPTKSGTFKFKLSVSVKDPNSDEYSESYDDGDDLCYSSIVQDYEIRVTEP